MSIFKKDKKIRINKRSSWYEDAEYRQKNGWLLYSSKIARRILSGIANIEDYSQVKLAEKLNVTPQRISKIVKGKENLTLETIYNISQALNIELISFPDYKFSTKNSKRNVEDKSEIDSITSNINKYSDLGKIRNIINTNQESDSEPSKEEVAGSVFFLQDFERSKIV